MYIVDPLLFLSMINKINFMAIVFIFKLFLGSVIIEVFMDQSY